MKKLNRKSISVATVVVASILALLLGAAATPINRAPGVDPGNGPYEEGVDNLLAPPVPGGALPIQPLALEEQTGGNEPSVWEAADNLSPSDAPHNLIEPDADAGPDVDDFIDLGALCPG